ncbi:MAG: HAD-IA family hydrolase, partial [Anaerolineae bacterium]|nr:HAD-IA family hydrolase [Anaerolineae bacterium]
DVYKRQQYGTALRGMIEEKIPFDREEFFRFVHDFELDSMQPDPSVQNMLSNLPMRKAVLTNSNIEHAERVLQHLQLSDYFEKVIDIKALDFVNKPWPEAYLRALDMMGGVAPHKAMLVEDSAANTRTAKEMGMLTVLVDTPISDDAHYFVEHVNQVGELVAKISRKDGKAQ